MSARRQPPLRKFLVRTLNPEMLVQQEDFIVSAHYAFDNTRDGGTLVFRRYLNGDVRTEKVAEFRPGSWTFYKEIQEN